MFQPVRESKCSEFLNWQYPLFADMVANATYIVNIWKGRSLFFFFGLFLLLFFLYHNIKLTFLQIQKLYI